MHQPSANYCGVVMEDGTIATDRVQRRICGAPPDLDPPDERVRDLHVEAWSALVNALHR